MFDEFDSHVADWLAQLPKSHERKQQQQQYGDAFLVFEKIDELLEQRKCLEPALKSGNPLEIEAANRLIPKLDEEVRALYLSIGLGPDGKTQAAPVVADSAPGGTAVVWTTERKKAARAMMNEQRGQGVKAFAANTAAAFGVTPTRLRQVLNDKPKKTPAKKTTSPWRI